MSARPLGGSAMQAIRSSSAHQARCLQRILRPANRLHQHTPVTCQKHGCKSVSAGTGLPRRHYATSAPTPTSIQRTALYDFHVEHGGKMVPFAGYSMPVQYASQSITDSHKWTREKASIFDVSHMLQHHFSGPGAADFLARLTPSAPKLVLPFRSGLSALLNEEGGIVDDTIITNITEEGDKDQRFYVVTNAGCREKDLKFFKAELAKFEKENPGKTVNHETLETHGLIALQGPLSAEILGSISAKDSKTGGPLDVEKLYFGQSTYADFGDIKRCLVSRGGYTGEDGFEISVPASPSSTSSDSSNQPHQVIDLTKLLLEHGGPDKIKLAGLGARDSLRLEAGMCLYGHDLDETTTPVEAGLSWIVSKERRKQGGFNGSSKILEQLKPIKEGGKGPARRRVGFFINDPAPAREGAAIVDKEGKEIGKITSGGPSPTLGKNIAMGYIQSGFHKAGTDVGVVVRKKTRPATVTKMPFIDAKYWREPAEKKV